MTHSQILLNELVSFLDDLKASKPDDRSELDRRYAILITDVMRVIAWLTTFIVPLDTRGADQPALVQDQVWEQ